jgi:hypothetical protein
MEYLIPRNPIYGYSSRPVFVRDNVREPIPTGLAAFRAAKARCLADVQSLAPGCILRVHKIEVRNRDSDKRPFGIEVCVTTITDQVLIKVRTR